MALDSAPDEEYKGLGQGAPGRERWGLGVLDFGRTLEAAQAGDPDAFACLWRRYQPGLLRYLTVKAAPVAEDLAANVWTRVVGALPAFRGDEQHFKAWLYTTARNRLTDWYRSRQRRAETVPVAFLDRRVDLYAKTLELVDIASDCFERLLAGVIRRRQR